MPIICYKYISTCMFDRFEYRNKTRLEVYVSSTNESSQKDRRRFEFFTELYL